MNLLQSKLLYHIRHENDCTSIFHSKTEEMFGMKHIWKAIFVKGNDMHFQFYIDLNFIDQC